MNEPGSSMPRFNEANKTTLGSARRSVLEKQFDRADTVRDVRLALIRSRANWCLASKPNSFWLF
jgi:hypothetical protein